MSPLLPRASRPASSSSLLRRFLLPLLVAVLPISSALAQTQSLVVDRPTTLTPGGTVNVGSSSGNSSYSSGPGFHFTQPVTITSVTYDPGPDGAQELAVERLYGASCFYNQQLPAGSECGVETGIFPVYPGLRSGTLRITTTSGVFIIPVTFNVTLPQVALTPGVLSSPITIASQPVTQTGDSLAVDAVGNLYLGDENNHVVRKVDATTGAVSLFAGLYGNPSYSGDGGPATSAGIMYPRGLSISPAGDVYILTIGVDSNDILRKVDLGTGNISTAATAVTGRSISVFAPAPDGAAVVDQNGTIFVAVPFQNKINAISNGVTTTIVNGTTCNTGTVYQPFAMTVGGGYLYFYSQGAIYKVSTDTTQCNPVTLVAGTGLGGNSGDWGPATSATFGTISGLALDAAGNLYLADSQNNEVRVVNAATGQISPIAGPNTYLYSVTVLAGLSSLAIDVRGNLYVLGTNDEVQKIDVSQVSLTFDTTQVGATSTDSPKYTYATDIGTAPVPSGTTTIPTNYVVDPSSTCMNTTGAYPALGVAATCFTAVDFKPTTTANPTGQLGFAGATINLSGVATQPQTTVNISPSSIYFGTVTQGSSSGTWTINIANTGAYPLVISGTALVDSTDFQVSGNCYAPIPAYQSCNLTVVFKPQSSGYLSGSLTLQDNAGSGTQTIPLSGNATSYNPVIGVSPNSIDFGSVGVGTTSPVWTVYVSNTGPTPLFLNTVTLSEKTDFAMTNSCPANVPAYGGCNITLTFSPTSAGNFTGQLDLLSNSNATATHTYVTLYGYGSGSGTPTLQISPSSIDFGSVGVGGSSGVWTLYMGNTGPTAVSISSIVLSDTTNFHLFGACSSIPANGSCEETVTFTPQTQTDFKASIVVAFAGSSGTQTVPLTGYGSAPNYTVAVTPSVLTLHSGQTGTALFAFTPTGGFTGSINLACNGLPAGATCTFSPATFTADGSNTPLTSKVTVTTIGLGPQSSIHSNSGIAFAGLLGLLTLGGLRRRRKTLPALLLALLVFAGMTTLSGCGSGISAAVTPAGNHAISVTATATATQKTQTGSANVGSSSQAAQLTLTIVE